MKAELKAELVTQNAIKSIRAALQELFVVEAAVKGIALPIPEPSQAAIQEAVKAEREACAQVAEQTPLRSPVAEQRDKIAGAIRARSAQ